MNAKKYGLGLLLLLVWGITFSSCDDDDSYADRRERERSQISAFLQNGVQVKAENSDMYILDVPGNINVISEQEFYANDSMTNVSRNEYVYFENTGVYMQIIRKGAGEKLGEGQSATIINRYIEYNIATDTIQSTNRTLALATNPDIMSCQNNYGVFTASFTAGVMKTMYNSNTVPAGWLVPLNFINIGRQDSPEEGIALVRLIVPSTQGQNQAAYDVYPCFYEISYQRGR